MTTFYSVLSAFKKKDLSLSVCVCVASKILLYYFSDYNLKRKTLHARHFTIRYFQSICSSPCLDFLRAK